MYYLARFKGYQLVVFTQGDKNALHRLVEFVRVTKGNLGYEESQIRQEAIVREIHFVDDLGEFTKLGNLKGEIHNLEYRFNQELKELRGKVEALQGVVRAAAQHYMDEEDTTDWDY